MEKEKLHQISISELILIEQYLQQSYGDLNSMLDTSENKEKIEEINKNIGIKAQYSNICEVNKWQLL